jgi:DNA-directed RNA polymerase subunit F
MADKKQSTPENNQRAGAYTLECIGLLDQSFDALIRRSELEAPFSADLTGSIAPVVRALRTAKATLVRSYQDQIGKMSAEALKSIDEQLRSAGSDDLLRSAIALGDVTPDLENARTIVMANGAKRIPWLEIIKEILNLLIDIIPIPLPSWLKKLIKELLKILDKIFGGMPHEDHAPASLT